MRFVAVFFFAADFFFAAGFLAATRARPPAALGRDRPEVPEGDFFFVAVFFLEVVFLAAAFRVVVLVFLQPDLPAALRAAGFFAAELVERRPVVFLATVFFVAAFLVVVFLVAVFWAADFLATDLRVVVRVFEAVFLVAVLERPPALRRLACPRLPEDPDCPEAFAIPPTFLKGLYTHESP